MKINEGVQFPVDSSAKILTAGPAGRPVRRHRARRRRQEPGQRRPDQADPVRRRAGEPDRPADLQQGRRRRQHGRAQPRRVACSCCAGRVRGDIGIQEMTFHALARALPRVVAALVLAAVAGCATAPPRPPSDRHTAGPEGSVRAVQPQGVRVQRHARHLRAQAGGHGLRQGRAVADPHRRAQLLRQLLGRLVGRQPAAARQAAGRRLDDAARAHQHHHRHRRPVRSGHQPRAGAQVRGSRPDAGRMGPRAGPVPGAAAVRLVRHPRRPRASGRYLRVAVAAGGAQVLEGSGASTPSA